MEISAESGKQLKTATAKWALYQGQLHQGYQLEGFLLSDKTPHFHQVANIPLLLQPSFTSVIESCCILITLYHYKVSVVPASQIPHTYLRAQGKILQRMAMTFGLCHPLGRWIIESLRLERISKIIKFNLWQNTTFPTKPYHKLSSLLIFWTLVGMVTPLFSWEACSNV